MTNLILMCTASLLALTAALIMFLAIILAVFAYKKLIKANDLAPVEYGTEKEPPEDARIIAGINNILSYGLEHVDEQ